MKIYEKIKNIREENNLTQEEFADKLGISVNAVKNYEDKEKERIPSTDILLTISRKFGVSTDYLLHDEISNRHYNDIKIGEELSLTDESIEILRGIKDTHNFNIRAESIDLSNRLDLFIKKVNLPELMVNIELLQWLSEMYNGIVIPLSGLAKEQNLIIKSIKNKDENSLKELFKKYEMLLSDLENYTNDFYKITTFYIENKIDYEKAKKHFEELKSNVLKGILSKYEGKTYLEGLSEYQNVILDIANNLINDIDLQEYKINKIIMNFTENLQSEEYDKWRGIYGSKRNNKK